MFHVIKAWRQVFQKDVELGWFYLSFYLWTIQEHHTDLQSGIMLMKKDGSCWRWGGSGRLLCLANRIIQTTFIQCWLVNSEDFRFQPTVNKCHQRELGFILALSSTFSNLYNITLRCWKGQFLESASVTISCLHVLVGHVCFGCDIYLKAKTNS